MLIHICLYESYHHPARMPANQRTHQKLLACLRDFSDISPYFSACDAEVVQDLKVLEESEKMTKAISEINLKNHEKP